MCAVPSVGHAQAFEAQMIEWELATQRLISAIKVDTRQHGAASAFNANTDESTARAVSSVFVEVFAQAGLVQARLDYGLGTGQTDAACQIPDIGLLASEASTVQENVLGAAKDSDASWVIEGGDSNERLAEGLAFRRQLYCSDAEREAGLCGGALAAGGPGSMPAGDSNAGSFLLRRSYGSEELLVGLDFIDVVAPLPTISPAGDVVDVGSGISRLISRRRAALLSVPRGALFEIVSGGLEGTGEILP